MSFHRSQARFLQVPMTPLPQRTVDRIIDRRTVGQIISDMERNAADPVEIAKRNAFYAAMHERMRRESIRHHIREAFETMALELLEDCHADRP